MSLPTGTFMDSARPCVLAGRGIPYRGCIVWQLRNIDRSSCGLISTWKPRLWLRDLLRPHLQGPA